MIKISDSEWEVLRVVWNNPDCDAHLVSEVLGESKDWQKSTVKTLLARLVKKGALNTTRVRNKFIYTPTVTEERSLLVLQRHYFLIFVLKKLDKQLPR